MANTYVVGGTANERATIKVGGVLTDPTTVTATVYSPSGVSSTPTQTHPGTGIYDFTWVLSEAGDWMLRVVTTGVAAGVQEIIVNARRTEIPGANLIAEALVTVTDMRFFLDRTGLTSDLDEVRWLEDLINAYSLAIAKFCNRQFTPERDASAASPARRALKSDPLLTAQTKKFRYDGDGYLDFSPYEPRTVTSVVFGTDLPTSSQVTLFAGDTTREAEYRLEPPQKTTEGTFLWAVLPRYDKTRRGGWYGWSGWPSAPSSGVVPGYLGGLGVTVTGDWGAADGQIPNDVAHACKIQVGDAFRNPESYTQRAAGGIDITEDTSPGSLSPAVRALCWPYKRP